MWSLGCVIYALLTGNPPFAGDNQEEIQQRIIAGRYDVSRLTRNSISDNAADLVKKLLITDPTKRMNEKEALRHPWLDDGTSEDDCSQGALPQYIDEDEEEILSQNIEVWETVKGRLEAQDPQQPDVDVHDLVNTKHPDLLQDDEGDVEIEGSQEQAQRLERERAIVPSSQLRQVQNVDSLDKTVMPMRRHLPNNSLLAPSDHEGSIGASDENSDFAGLSRYADDIHDDDEEVSSPDAAYADSGVLGQSRVSAMEEESDDDSQLYGAQTAGRITDSMTSSRGDGYQFDSFIGIAKTPTSERSMTLPSRRRTPGPDGRSLAGMRTMVGNLNVASTTASESILHRKGSGRLSMDDRVTKRTSSPSLRRKSSPHEAPALSRVPLENRMSVIDSEGSNPLNSSPPHLAKTDSMVTGPTATIANTSIRNLDGAENFENLPQGDSDNIINSRPKTIWGRLTPLPGSISHESINLVEQHVRYGRSSACICFVADTRVSKHHFVLLFAREDDIEAISRTTENEESFSPEPQMKAWIKVLGSNGMILHGRKLIKNDFFRVYHQDELIVFRDKRDFLGFKIDLLIGTHTRTREDLKNEEEWDALRAFQIAQAKQAKLTPAAIAAAGGAGNGPGLNLQLMQKLRAQQPKQQGQVRGNRGFDDEHMPDA
ncbi:hypothetical protein ABW19_dt0209057 [Dactylella cylindrospora]|nr:hypothetical protein ABW19_dt0209057 [Dactylella cylindrospora]